VSVTFIAVRGSVVVDVPELPIGDIVTGVNLSNTNAWALLGLLGLDGRGLLGQVTIAEARRAVMYARATFERRASGYTRETVTERTMWRADASGVVRLRPITMIAHGLDADALGERLGRFAVLVERAAAGGATGIAWA